MLYNGVAAGGRTLGQGRELSVFWVFLDGQHLGKKQTMTWAQYERGEKMACTIVWELNGTLVIDTVPYDLLSVQLQLCCAVGTIDNERK